MSFGENQISMVFYPAATIHQANNLSLLDSSLREREYVQYVLYVHYGNMSNMSYMSITANKVNKDNVHKSDANTSFLETPKTHQINVMHMEKMVNSTVNARN